MADRIKLKPASQLQASDLQPGELAIDEAARLLYLDRGDSHPPEPIPLDNLPVPPGLDHEPAEVAILTAEGVGYAPLIRGGGAAPLGSGWLTPGVLTVNFANRTANLRLEAIIEIPSTARLIGMRTHPAAGEDILINYGVQEIDGTVIVEDETSAYAGPAEIVVDEVLAPGRYKVFLQAESALVVSCLIGAPPWALTTSAYPVFLRFADAT